jgi:hypothetical protein
MAVISGNTFNALQRYVAVRLQQGVPLVDADWNAMEDGRRYELRAYLKWFVGDGVPEGNDGFRVVGQNVVDDFLISKGFTGVADPVQRIGRILVDGLDVIVDNDLPFRSQPLHTSQAGAAARAAALGVPVVAEMPVLDGTVAVYLDVWERLVTPAEDPALVLPGLGTESCARLKREWVVRARVGTTAPTPADVGEFINGHSYYLLATVTRRAAAGNVRASDVSDSRELRLLVPPAFLVTDLLGTTPSDYRHGVGRPVISLRDAINALLRGELPSSPEAAVSPAAGVDQHRRAFVDGLGGLCVLWESDRVGAVNQVFASRLDLSNIAAGFSAPPRQVTAFAAPGAAEPHATMVPGGDVVVAYTRGAGPNADVFLRRAPVLDPAGPFAGLTGAADQPVAATAAQQEDTPFLVLSGNVVVAVWHNATTNLWMYRRYRHTDNTWIDAAPGLQFSATVTTQRDIHAARDPGGTVWAAFRAGNDIRAMSFAPGTGTVANEITLDSLAPDLNPFVLCRANGDVHVYWTGGAPAVIWSAVFAGGVWGAPAAVTFPVAVTPAGQSAAAELPDGRIWLSFSRGTAPTRDVWVSVRAPTGTFGNPIQLTFDSHDDLMPFSAVDPVTSALYMLWTSDRGGNLDLFYKRIVTAV